MRVTSMQPIDYLKVHLAYDGIKTGIYRAFKRITRKTLALAEESVVVIVAMAIVLLFIVTFLKLDEVAAFTSNCCNVLFSILASTVAVL